MKNHLLMFDLELEDNVDKIKEWLQYVFTSRSTVEPLCARHHWGQSLIEGVSLLILYTLQPLLCSDQRLFREVSSFQEQFRTHLYTQLGPPDLRGILIHVHVHQCKRPLIIEARFHYCISTIVSDSDILCECPPRTLCELYTFQPFTERLPPGSGSLKEMLETCITVAVPVWFTAQEARTQPQVQVCLTYAV